MTLTLSKHLPQYLSVIAASNFSSHPPTQWQPKLLFFEEYILPVFDDETIYYAEVVKYSFFIKTD